MYTQLMYAKLWGKGLLALVAIFGLAVSATPAEANGFGRGFGGFNRGFVGFNRGFGGGFGYGFGGFSSTFRDRIPFYSAYPPVNFNTPSAWSYRSPDYYQTRQGRVALASVQAPTGPQTIENPFYKPPVSTLPTPPQEEPQPVATGGSVNDFKWTPNPYLSNPHAQAYWQQ